jgi:hypothetical protein
LEHDLVHDKPPKKNASAHDLGHDKPPKKALIGARIGAQQTAKKNTHWSTIWWKKNNIILAPAQQQTWQTNR